MGVSPGDVRLTTRYDPAFLADGFFSVLHEAGHGIYEQGLDADRFGLPRAQACSLGIHESQSRLWENLVGRSRGFWAHFYPAAREAFAPLRQVPLDAFWRAVNEVKPSLIRVDADEVTYNLHIFLRFELEVELLAGDLAVADLPEAWNERFEEAFRIRPPSDAKGCLQDIHWSAGLFGYFPTYTLGNVYAAHFFARAMEQLGDLEAAFAKGEFTPLREWLGGEIHRHGRRFPPRELVERVCGRAPEPTPLIAQLETKYAEIYSL
jgi:carboxypeptidase Taq